MMLTTITFRCIVYILHSLPPFFNISNQTSSKKYNDHLDLSQYLFGFHNISTFLLLAV